MDERKAERLEEHRKEITRGVIILSRFKPPVQPDSQEESLSSSLIDIARQKKLADKVQKALVKLHPAGNRLSLPETERPNLEEVLKQNLLDIADDNTLAVDIFPQENPDAKGTISVTDPFWGHILPLLTVKENRKVFKAFKALRTFYSYLHADSALERTRINALMRESLEPGKDATFQTVGDLRRISLRGWLSIPGIGIPTANLILKAIKKIEVPAE